MNRRKACALAALILSAALSHAAVAEEGFGTVTFKVQVTGRHNVPSTHGGFRNIDKSRTFSGSARVRYVGGSPASEVWANESCSGTLQVADKGAHRGISEVGMINAAYSLSSTQQVKGGSLDPDSCSFSLTYDPQTQSAQISVDPGPSNVAAVERMDDVSTKTHLNPFDWSSIGQFNKNAKVTASKSGHSGVWVENGQPLALSGYSRAKGELVESTTRITWEFTGQRPSNPAQSAQKYDEVETVPGGIDDAAIAGCVKEAQAGRTDPDPLKLMECLQKKANAPRR